MEEFNWSLVLDLVMIGMLGGTMAYAYVLNKNLNILRSEKAAFEQSITRLSSSIRQAETGLHDLKLSAQEVGGQLESHISAARGLSQELQFMVASADSLANRLSNAAETIATRNTPANTSPSAANEIPPIAPPTKGPPALGNNRIAPEDAKPRSQAEARLLEELKRIEVARAQKSAGGAG